MSLRRRLALLFGCFALLAVVSAVLSLSAVLEREESIEQLQGRYQPARSLLADLQYEFVDQETGVRGYVITGDERFLQPYTRSREEVPVLLADLRDLLGDDPRMERRVAGIESAAERWQATVAEPEIAVTRAQGAGAAAELVAAGHGRELFDALRQDVAGLREEIEAAEADAITRFDAARQRVSTVLFATVGITSFLLFLTAVLLQTWIAAPLTRLAASVRRVADGALSQPVEVRGPRDVVQLGNDVERMRQRLAADLEAAVAAQEALRQQAPAVAVLREQLRPDPPPGGPVDVAAAFQPAEGFLAGDWYDVLAVGDGGAALAVVDVSGHGPRAGGLALQAKLLLCAALREGMAPGAALGWLARHLDDTGEAFLTAFVAVLDGPQGIGAYASAGHPPALLVSEGIAAPCDPTGPLLGPLPGTWESVPFGLEPDDVLVVYTDGLIEARDDSGEEFGVERLRQALVGAGQASPRDLVEACMTAVRAFRHARFEDDVTLVALARSPVAASPAFAAAEEGSAAAGAHPAW
jgi:sigma-B regulation protein RsbU (phosphoserine phosphatase)